ncbi:hypothetical protein [Archangium primigenium]|uniref:hypothetical protein n=1 Tax=[Archangium] primigenium TaxID=2792470 RepID=UPI00195C02DE|nr:hypothetical protein [Archangium primigenium]
MARAEVHEETRPPPRALAEAPPPENVPEAPASWPEPPPLDASEPEEPQALLREWERRRRLDHEQGAL